MIDPHEMPIIVAYPMIRLSCPHPLNLNLSASPPRPLGTMYDRSQTICLVPETCECEYCGGGEEYVSVDRGIATGEGW